MWIWEITKVYLPFKEFFAAEILAKSQNERKILCICPPKEIP